MIEQILRVVVAAGVFLGAVGCSCQALAGSPQPPGGSPDRLRVYAGTFTWNRSRGIYLLDLDLGSGRLSSPMLVAQVRNPAFLAMHPARPLLYAVGELDEVNGSPGGAVYALAIDSPSGNLTLINQELSGGRGPCHLTVDREGRNVLVANYGSGTVAVLPLRPDGGLAPASCVIQHRGAGPNKQRQEGPHAHSIDLDPAGRFALAADLGIDRIMLYRFDADKGLLVSHEPSFASLAPGAGPRHLAFHPSGSYAYVINELACTVTALAYDSARGQLKELHTVSTLPAEFKGQNTAAEIRLDPSGRFLYGSNRGHNSIAIFAVDPQSGRLTALGHQQTRGKTPRNFAIDPSGRFLLVANQDSDSVVVFRIDSASGLLIPTDSAAEVPCPVCLLFMKAPK